MGFNWAFKGLGKAAHLIILNKVNILFANEQAMKNA